MINDNGFILFKMNGKFCYVTNCVYHVHGIVHIKVLLQYNENKKSYEMFIAETFLFIHDVLNLRIIINIC